MNVSPNDVLPIMPTFFGVPLFATEAGGMRFFETRYEAAQVLPRHDHQHAYMCFVLAGEYEEISSTGRVDAMRGALLGHPEGHRHGNRFGNRGARCLNVIPDAQWREEFGWARLLDRATHTHVGKHAAPTAAVLKALSEPDNLSPLVLASSILELIINTHRQTPERGRPRFVNRVIDMVNANISSPLSMVDLAREVAIHPAHLSRVFKQQTGMTIGTFARQARLQVALEQMANSSTSLSTIAVQAGFSDQAHMTRAVRAETGLTPSMYRRMMQGQFKKARNVQ
jgi:AraC family transcriptional regulator